MKVVARRQLKQIVNFAKKNCDLSNYDHKFDHIDLTVKLSKYLAMKEKANLEVCTVAGYLHDIAADKSRTKHGAVGARIAEKFLLKIGVPDFFVKQVCYAIAQHNNGSHKKTKEAEVLWDADKLQLIGPLGFARILRFCFLSLNYEDIYPAIDKSEKYENFFYKRFYTSTGRKIAKKLHNSMSKFHKLCWTVKTVRLTNL